MTLSQTLLYPEGENTPDLVVGVRRDKKRHPDYDHTRVPRVL